jgi:hypothetical protein
MASQPVKIPDEEGGNLRAPGIIGHGMVIDGTVSLCDATIRRPLHEWTGRRARACPTKPVTA